jgi:hypothetical protein
MKRATLILALGAILLLVGVLCAGEGLLPFSMVLGTDGLIALLWVVAAGISGSLILRRLRIPVTDALGIITAAGLGLGLYSLTALGLGLAGWLNRWTALALPCLSCIIFVADLFSRYGNISLDGAKERIKQWLRVRPPGAWLWLAAAPFLALATFGATLPPSILWKAAGDPHPYDVLEYHLEAPREWYQLGRIVPLRHNAYSFFPFNVEMQYLLAMHLSGGPWAGMYLAQFMSLSYSVLAVLAIYAVGRSLMEKEDSPFGATLGAVAAASVPWLTMLGCVAYNECGLLLYSTLAIGWTLRASRESTGRLRSFALAGVMAGLACGVKYTAAATLLAAIPLVLILLPSHRLRPRDLLAGCGVFLAAGIICFSPWLVRNWQWAGNPVFPEAMNIFGRGHFSELQQQRWEQAHSPRTDQRSLQARGSAFLREIINDGRYGYVFWPLAAVAAFNTRDRRLLMLLVGLFGVQTIFWLFFTHLQSRFFVTAIPIAAILIAQPIRWRALQTFMCAGVILSSAVSFVWTWRTLWRESHDAAMIGLPDLSIALDRALKERIDAGATLDLIGDAKAFLYVMPIQKLRYRTAFDVDIKPGQSIEDAWLGPDADAVRRPRGSHIRLVDPAELNRLLTTYQWPPGVKPVDRRLPPSP